MTKNDTGTLCVRFIPDINDVYPLSIIIVDDRNNRTYLQIRQNEIDPLMECLWVSMSPALRLTTMTGEYVVKWWYCHEVALINHACLRGRGDTVVLHCEEAMELVDMVRREMFSVSSTSESDPLSGANKRRHENLRSVFG